MQKAASGVGLFDAAARRQPPRRHPPWLPCPCYGQRGSTLGLCLGVTNTSYFPPDVGCACAADIRRFGRWEDKLTSYSVSESGGKATITANWPGETSDRSTKVTSLNDVGEAEWLAHSLTRLSEHAWGAAAWLDTSVAVEASIATLIERLRSHEGPLAVELADSGGRHAEELVHRDLAAQLSNWLPAKLSQLSRGQRVSVADELAADTAGREEALRVLPSGWDPESSASRAWQMCEVPRSWDVDRAASLPEGGPGWIHGVWMTEVSPAKRWGARDRLVRLEQLAAACKAYGGRAKVDSNPTHVHLVVPPSPGSTRWDEFEVVKVFVHGEERDNGWADPFAPLIIRKYGGGQVREETKVEPEDDDAFAKVLGEWTRLVPYTYFERDYES